MEVLACLARQWMKERVIYKTLGSVILVAHLALFVGSTVNERTSHIYIGVSYTGGLFGLAVIMANEPARQLSL